VNKAEIRNLARTITELEAADVADATIDLYIKDGYDRMISLERRWPFFEQSATLSSVANQRDYPVSSVGSGNFREITSLVNTTSGARLQLISYDQGEQVFIADGSDFASEPRWWSLWGNSIQLWPKPDSVYSLSVRGYRKPTDWHLSDSTEVDADDRMHRSLVYYTVAQLYQLQEDVEMASFYRSTFDEAVRLARADVIRVPSHAPLILSGGDPRWWLD
jgi:hypothetical protein